MQSEKKLKEIRRKKKEKHRKDELKKLDLIISSTQDTVDNFKRLYKTRDSSKGSPKHVDQDLLRAIIVFSCAGLDAFQKSTITNLYEVLLSKSHGAKTYFNEQAERLIKKNEQSFDYKFFAKILVSGDSKIYLMNEVRKDLLSGSLQSFESLNKTITALGLDKNEIITDDEEVRLLFKARNEIIHEMDLDINAFKKGKKKRIGRKQDDIFSKSELTIQIMKNLHNSLKKLIL